MWSQASMSLVQSDQNYRKNKQNINQYKMGPRTYSWQSCVLVTCCGSNSDKIFFLYMSAVNQCHVTVWETENLRWELSSWKDFVLVFCTIYIVPSVFQALPRTIGKERLQNRTECICHNRFANLLKTEQLARSGNKIYNCHICHFIR